MEKELNKMALGRGGSVAGFNHVEQQGHGHGWGEDAHQGN
jgi:hypothetical protein